MIKYGLKLWTSNERSIFEEALVLCQKGQAQFIEIYNNPDAPLDNAKLSLIKGLEVNVHNTHSHGFHEFNLGDQQLALWQDTLKLADFFNSQYIILHPGQARDFDHFEANLKKIDDPRILIENMAGLDIYGQNVYANSLESLRAIKNLKNICFDLEKAVKAAKYQNLDYKDFIDVCLKDLQPFYFHLSGGDKNSPIDEHQNLWEANFDLAWIKDKINKIAEQRDVFLVFETPQQGGNLTNDLENMNFFRQA